MKILLVGDVHSKIGNIRNRTFLMFLDRLIRVTKEYNPDLVALLGDQLDSHAIIRAEVVYFWTEYFKRINTRHFMMVGNHEEAYPGSKIHSLVAFQAITEVIDKPTAIGDVLFLPYYYDKEKFREATKDGGNILICHQSFLGAVFENGREDPDGVPLEWVSGFKEVISGHIHKQQQISNVWYPGTPFAHSYADVDEKKGIWLYDTETKERTFIDTELPAYHSAEFNSPDWVVEWFDNRKEGDFYQIAVKGAKSAIDALQSSLSYKQLKDRFHIKLKPEYTDSFEKLTERISDRLSPERMVLEYVERFVKNPNVDKDRLGKMALGYMENVA